MNKEEFLILHKDNPFIRDICDCGNEITLKQLRKVLPRNKTAYCSRQCAARSKEAQNKRKQTSLEKYGYPHPMQNKLVKEIFNNSMMKTHGVKWATQSKEILQTIKEQNLEKYGVSSPMKDPHLLNEKLSKQFPYIDRKFIDFIKQTYNNDNPIPISKREELFLKSGFKTRDGFRGFLKNNNIPYEIKGSCESYYELELREFIKSFDINFITNTSKIISPFELDIYIPRLKLGIEVNGDYWHQIDCHVPKDKDYHLNKTNLCESKGIRLIHIWEHEWKNNQDYVKYILSCYLNNQIPEVEHNKLSRDYFQRLDFPEYNVELPMLEKSREFHVYKTGYLVK